LTKTRLALTNAHCRISTLLKGSSTKTARLCTFFGVPDIPSYVYKVKRKQLVLLHITCWSLFFISNLARDWYTGIFAEKSTGIVAFTRTSIIELFYTTIPITCFYCSYLVVAPRLFVSKRYFLTAFYTLLTFAFMLTLRYLSEYHFFLPVFGFDNYRGHSWSVWRYIDNVFFVYFPTYFVYGLLLFFAENWYANKHLQQELEKERSSAELAFLRSQLNPHFLFNTLNDIYSLTYQKSEKAPEALLKLSELLRYMLREGNENFVSLTQEIQYLESLGELQKISSKGNAFINFKAEGAINEQKVASLLFVSFIENAFKHGVLTDSFNPVNISLAAEAGKVRFSIRNKINDSQKDNTGGIGLSNVRRRLELLYPGKHQLEILKADEFYQVNLSLQTN